MSHARSSVKKSFLAQIERCLPREAVLFTRLLRRGKIKIVVSLTLTQPAVGSPRNSRHVNKRGEEPRTWL